MTRFIINGDSTVADSQTGLVWTQQTIAREINPDRAVQVVSELGPNWRLPTIHELFSLVDHSRKLPAIDTSVFPDTDSDWYWTSTPCVWRDDAVWVVDFHLGAVDSYRRDDGACVRAVRAGQ